MDKSRWDFCDTCNRFYMKEHLSKCAYCGDKFCPFCAHDLSDADMLLQDEDSVTFCSHICERDYKGGHRRSSRGQTSYRRTDSSDE